MMAFLNGTLRPSSPGAGRVGPGGPAARILAGNRLDVPRSQPQRALMGCFVEALYCVGIYGL